MSKQGISKVFLILEGLNALVRVPKHTFITNDRENAKVYFESYIKNMKSGTYSLYEICEITKDEIKEERIFITASTNLNNNYIKQLNLYKERKQLEEAKKEKEQIEILKKLFDAEEIKDDKEKIS